MKINLKSNLTCNVMEPVTVFVKTILLMSIEIFLFHESYLLLPNQVLLIVT